ncbi:MAG: glycosyltransferase [Acidovorax sp.]
MTVVLPAYNHASYVVEAIESVRAQTLTRWELIVINDGSTDNTWAVLQDYIGRCDDARIQLHTQANMGSHATLNRGLAMARAPYVAVLNSDDRYAPHRLQRLVDVAQAAGGYAFIVTGLRLIDAHGGPLPTDHWWNTMYKDLLQRWHAHQSSAQHSAVDVLLWGNFTVSTSNFFMSRALWQKVGNFRHLRFVPDWDYALRVAGAQPQAFHFLADEPLLDYRLHGRNTILGGALHNHAEAYWILRSFQKKWAAAGHALPEHAIDRLHYLARFIRHEHARQQLERQKTGWVQQVVALRSALDEAQANGSQVSEQAVHWQAQAQQSQAQAVQWQAQAQSWQSIAEQMQASRSWRLTTPLRALGGHVRSLRRKSRALLRKLATRSQRAQAASATSAYGQWLQSEAVLLKGLHQQASQCIADLPSQPLISIIMPVHDTPRAFLQAAVESVRAQWYGNWELCICNDACGLADTLAYLQALQDGPERRIKLVHRSISGHIVHATNDALALAQGEFAVFLDHDDQLAPHALLRLVQAINAPSAPDCIYSDEDKLDEQGQRCLPLFKPDWSPVLEWSQNYVGHIMCVRRTLLQAIGGFLEGSQGSQDHDLVLRLALQGARFAHIPEVLYHWRMHAASTASSPESKPYAHEAGKQAVSRHLSVRYGEQFDRVEDSDYTFVYQPRFRVPGGMLASIIIPTKDKADLLQACIQSIQRHTVGLAYEILVLDNGSIEPATHACFERLTRDARVRVLPAHIPFNWSRLNNIGRSQARGQVLVFLNNDTEVISPDWLLRLAEYALLPDVATVGPLLLYPDHTIQHAGVVVGMGGWADHVFKTEPVRHYPTPFISSVVPRNVLANTGACMVIATERFDALGGFDEAFEICGSDVELGIRAHKQGLLNVYLPAARLYHFESKTRSPHVPEIDFQQSALKYAPYRLAGDPFFNPNLDPFATSPRPRFPETSWPRAPRALTNEVE